VPVCRLFAVGDRIAAVLPLPRERVQLLNDQVATRIAVFSLGGTIAMTTQADGTVAPALSAEQLLAAVPHIGELGLELEVSSFRQLPGASLGYEDLFALAEAIGAAVDAGASGVVITQGTDTIEETAYFLDLVRDGRAPVVVTGAMRNPSMAGADGPANILAALRVAAAPDTPRRALVVFADEVHAATQVSKTHSTSITAFASSPGPIGYIAEDRVVYQSSPLSAPTLRGTQRREVRTALITATLGNDGFLLDAIAEHIDGLVVAGFGAGHVPAAYVPALEKLAARIPVVLTTRTGRGPVLTRTYGFPGSESDLLQRGLIWAGTLTPIKAKVQLHTALMLGATSAEIRALFEEEGSREGI
jgi:L-asparaginase